jgi:hypothetical protein
MPLKSCDLKLRTTSTPKEVLMHHGTLGVAVLTLVYFQVRSNGVACHSGGIS